MKDLSIKEYIQNRLKQFGLKGLQIRLDYQARINDFSDLEWDQGDFNRVLFTLCSFAKEHISITTTNCSQFFILSLDCNGSDLPPCHDGTAHPLGAHATPTFLLDRFKGQLSSQTFSQGRRQLTLRIPLNSNEDQGSPLLRVS